MASLTRWTWVWASSGVSDGQGYRACCSPWGHKQSDRTEWLNWANRFSHVERNAQHMLNVCLECIFKKVLSCFPEWLFSPVMSAPGPRRKKQWPHRRLAFGRLGVSSEGLGWWWPAARLWARTVAVHAWDLLREVTVIFIQFSSVQLLSHVQLCDPMDCSMPGLPVHHQLPKFTQTHIHPVGDAIQPSHPLVSPSPPAPNGNYFRDTNCKYKPRCSGHIS